MALSKRNKPSPEGWEAANSIGGWYPPTPGVREASLRTRPTPPQPSNHGLGCLDEPRAESWTGGWESFPNQQPLRDLLELKQRKSRKGPLIRSKYGTADQASPGPEAGAYLLLDFPARANAHGWGERMPNNAAPPTCPIRLQ